MAINKNKVMDAARKARNKGQVDKAIKKYLKIVREDPKDVRVWLKIGDLYAKKGAKPEATETYLKVAKFYSEQGFYLKAVAVYKQILKLDARLVEVNLKLAELYRQLGLISYAVFCLKKKNSSPYLLIGWLWYVFALFPVTGILQVDCEGTDDRIRYLTTI